MAGMLTIEQMSVDLVVNVPGWNKGLDEANKRLERFEKGVSKSVTGVNNALKGLSAAAAGVAIGGVLVEAVKASSEAEQSMKKVEQVLRSTGGAAGVTMKQVTDLSASLQRQTGVSDDAINSASALMLTFTKVGKEVFPQAISVVNDMSAALGQDLKSSSIQVGKALNDPVKGVTALQRVGVSFTASQKDMIKQLEATGRHAEAQAIILKELQTEFGGAAAAARDTLGGAFKALQNETGELMEALGAGSEGLRGVVELGVAGLQEMQEVVGSLKETFSSSVQNSAEFKGAIKIVGDVLHWAYEEAKLVVNVVAALGKAFFAVGKQIVDAFPKSFKDTLGGLWDNIVAGPKKVNAQLKKSGMDVAGDLEKAITAFGEKVTKRADENVKKIKEAAKNFKGQKGPAVEDMELGPTKEQKKLVKEFESIADSQAKSISALGDASNHHLASLQAQTEEQREQLRVKEELAKIDEAIDKVVEAYNTRQKNFHGNQKLVAQERIKLEGTIGDMMETREKVIDNFEKAREQRRKNHIADEKKNLDELLKSMQLQTKEEAARASGKEDDLKRAKIEAELDKIIKIGKGENLDIVKQIREEFEKQLKLTGDQAQEAEKLRKIHEEDLKHAKEMREANEDDLTALQAKAAGYGDIGKLLDQQRKIKNSSLSQAEKDKELDALAQQHAQMQGITDAMKRQDIVLDSITSGNKGYVNTVKDLQAAYSTGQINVRQYQEAMLKLSMSSREASDNGKEFAGSITKALSDGIANGKKFKDILKDIGKQMLVMSSKKLLEPLVAHGFDSILRKFGIGGTPGIGGPGGMISNASRTPLGAGGLMPFGAPASVPSASSGTANFQANQVQFSGTPVYINDCKVDINSPSANVNSGTVGGGVMQSIGNFFSNLTSGFTGILNNLLNLPKMLMSGLGGLFNTGRGLLGGAISGAGNAISGIGKALGIPFLASGGYARGGQPVIVGDSPSGDMRNAELMIPAQNMAVISNEQIMQALAQAMGVPTDTERWQGDKVAKLDSPQAFLDYRAWTQTFRGQPLFKQGQFAPDFSLLVGNSQILTPTDLQTSFDKWKSKGVVGAPSAMGLNLSAYNSEDWAKIAFALNYIPPDIDALMRSWMMDRDGAVRAFSATEWYKGRTDTVGGFQNFQVDRNQGRIKFPAGDQLSRMLMAWAHRIPMEKYGRLLTYANMRDWLMNTIEPTGGWQETIGATGSKEGMGGVGSGAFFSGVTDASVDPTGGDRTGKFWNGQGPTTFDPHTRMPTGLTIHTPTGGMRGGIQINGPDGWVTGSLLNAPASPLRNPGQVPGNQRPVPPSDPFAPPMVPQMDPRGEGPSVPKGAQFIPSGSEPTGFYDGGGGYMIDPRVGGFYVRTEGGWVRGSSSSAPATPGAVDLNSPLPFKLPQYEKDENKPMVMKKPGDLAMFSTGGQPEINLVPAAKASDIIKMDVFSSGSFQNEKTTKVVGDTYGTGRAGDLNMGTGFMQGIFDAKAGYGGARERGGEINQMRWYDVHEGERVFTGRFPGQVVSKREVEKAVEQQSTGSGAPIINIINKAPNTRIRETRGTNGQATLTVEEVKQIVANDLVNRGPVWQQVQAMRND